MITPASSHWPLLTLLILSPATGAVVIQFLRGRDSLCRWTALIFSLAEACFAASLYLLPRQEIASDLPGFFLIENLPWIERFGIRYFLAMDGISLLLATLTAFIILIAVLSSWRNIHDRVALHYSFILLIGAAIMGVFLAQDLILFYLFWEIMLVPMLFLIGIWGHGRRIYSAVKFFLVTLAGSLLMLLAIIGIYFIHGNQTGEYTFSFPALLGTQVSPTMGLWLFAAFLLGFAVKIPLFPVHTWLPDAHTDAPTAGSVILAGLLLKTGAYGLLRFAYPLLPSAAASFAPLIFLVALVGIIYGSWIAFAQQDMKRLVAYSSVGHMGYVALGIAAWTPVSLSGSVIQMVNHGVTTGALFALVGMLDERGKSRDIAAYGGLWGRIPVFSAFFLIFAVSSVGLPGLNNFVGEFLILAGGFKRSQLAIVIAFIGIILPLIYMARLIQELLFTSERKNLPMHDLSGREIMMLTLLLVADLYVGLHPAPLLDLISGPVSLLTRLPGGSP